MTREFSLFAATEKIGWMTVTADDRGSDNDFKVRWHVDDNGRGARLEEQVSVDASWVPLNWTIQGTSLMGGSVIESLQTNAGRAMWTSQADDGDVPWDGNAAYVPCDGTGWSWMLLAQATLHNGGQLPLLPSGQATTSIVDTLQEDGVRVIELSGVTLNPKYILQHTDGALDGLMDEQMLLVSPRLEDAAQRLSEIRERLALERLTRISARAKITDAPVVRLANVRVLDVEAGTLLPNTHVLIRHGKIASIGGSTDSPEALEIECQGMTLMPGLHDMHAHVFGPDTLLNIAAGVTNVRDMGNHPERLADLTAAINAGELLGPAITPAGLIEGRSPYSAKLGRIVSSQDEAVEAVHWYADHGYTMVKLYNSMHPEWVPATAKAAHSLGMRVLGHVPAFSTAEQSVLDGYDEITHLNQLALGWLLEPGEDSRTPLRLTALTRASELELDDPRISRTIELFTSRGIGVDTTAFIIERLMMSRSRETIEADAPFLDHMPPAYQRDRRRTYVPASGPEELETYRKAFLRLLEIMGLLHREGIKLWPGTDDGTGFPLHRELELYVQAGMSPHEVLRRATADCADHLGHGLTRGRIKEGYDADVILIDGDPLQNISAVRRVALVAVSGELFAPERIYQDMGIEPFATAPLIPHHVQS